MKLHLFAVYPGKTMALPWGDVVVRWNFWERIYVGDGGNFSVFPIYFCANLKMCRI